MWIRILYLFCDLWFQSLDYIFKWIFDLPLKQLYSGTEVLKNFPTKLEFFRWRVRVGPWPHWPGLAPYSSCSPDLWAPSRVFGWQSWLWVAYRSAVGTKMIVTTLNQRCLRSVGCWSHSRGHWSPVGWESGGMGGCRIWGSVMGHFFCGLQD